MEKADKGFELVYWKLSNRRKFIRTLWMIPWAVLALIIIQMFTKNYICTLISGVIFSTVFIAQLLITYKRWKAEENQNTETPHE